MAIEWICPGCRNCRVDLPENIEDGLCPDCLQRRDFPKPPPMRVGNGSHKSSGLGFYLAMCVVCIAFGIMCGLKMAGKA